MRYRPALPVDPTAARCHLPLRPRFSTISLLPGLAGSTEPTMPRPPPKTSAARPVLRVLVGRVALLVTRLNDIQLSLARSAWRRFVPVTRVLPLLPTTSAATIRGDTPRLRTLTALSLPFRYGRRRADSDDVV